MATSPQTTEAELPSPASGKPRGRVHGEDQTVHLVLLWQIVSIYSNSIKRMSEKTVNISRLASPRLLVSVRNAVEAEAALAGGCDVLDVKEPGRGAMGMADVSTIAAVLARIRATGSSVP